MSDVIHRMTAIMIGLALTMLTACGGSAPTRFYVLSPMDGAGMEVKGAGMEPRATIGIGPVSFPAYLDRRQIMTRVSRNELHLAGFEEWAEPLKDNFTRVLVEKLSHLLPDDSFAVFPFRGPGRVQCQVEVEVMRLDGVLGSDALIQARWAIYDMENDQMLTEKASRFAQPTAGPEYAAMAAAYSGLIEALSREMAGAIQTFCLKRGTS